MLNSPLNKNKKISDLLETLVGDTPTDIIPERILVRNVSLRYDIRLEITIAPRLDTNRVTDIKALLDSGANGIFIDRK